MAKGVQKKGTPGKKAKTESPQSPELSTKVVFMPFQALQGKSKERVSSIHSLVVAMLPVVASKRGFSGQYVSLTTRVGSYPALLLLDKHVKESVAIVSKDVPMCEAVSEGEDITITLGCPSLIAQEVSFTITSMNAPTESLAFTQFLKEQLAYSGLVICCGMNVVVQYLSQEVILRVSSVKLFGIEAETPFHCILQTHITVERLEEGNNTSLKKEVTFENVGGYQSEIESLRKQVDALFSRETSAIKPVRGILVSGPSGCGKTLIGKALKAKYGKKFISVPLEDMKSKFVGEPEQNLKQYFAEAAKRAPCLLFIDDIDVLCCSRERGGSAGVVTALLHLMDGVTGTADDVMVIATATQPQSLDSALRRPGRLSHDTFLGPLDAPARTTVLHHLLAGIPNDLTEAELSSLGDVTHGYIGGDLRSLVLEALIQANSATLSHQHLKASLAVIKPALVKDSVVDSRMKLCDLSGYNSLKSKLQEALSLTLQHGQVFQACGFPPPVRFLLFGPPGCGKSSLIQALAAEFHLKIIPVRRSTVLGKFFGESEQNLAKIFQQANESSPCIIHFENFEGLAGGKKDREGGGGVDVESRVVNHLKVQLDGIVQNDGIFIFAETTRPDLLNKDVIRPGRFHEYHLVGLPTPEDRKDILRNHLLPHSLTEDLSLDTIVDQTNHFTVAEILQFCEEVSVRCGGEGGQDTIASGVEEALEALLPNTSLRLLHKYRNFAELYSRT